MSPFKQRRQQAPLPHSSQGFPTYPSGCRCLRPLCPAASPVAAPDGGGRGAAQPAAGPGCGAGRLPGRALLASRGPSRWVLPHSAVLRGSASHTPRGKDGAVGGTERQSLPANGCVAEWPGARKMQQSSAEAGRRCVHSIRFAVLIAPDI